MRTKIAPRTTVVAAAVKSAADAQKSVAVAQQATMDAAERPTEPRVRRVPAENHHFANAAENHHFANAAERASRIPGARLVTPTISGVGVTVKFGEHSWRLPKGVQVKKGSSSDGREFAYARGPSGRITILIGTPQGIKELVTDSTELHEEIRRTVFGR